MNERILCLDIGDVRIGVAVSDALRMIATPVEVIRRVGFTPDVKRVQELCRQYDTTLVLSGLPLNMDGTEGFQAQKVKLFCQQLEKAGLTVYYQDERLTTVTAENALLEDNMHRAERKQHVDKVAAAVILQQWLDTAAHHPPQDESEEYSMADHEHKNYDAEEEADNFVELVDENGETVRFEHLATLDYEDECYIVLMLPEEELEEDEEEGGVVIMKVLKDDEGNDYYEYVDDENVANAVFARFEELMEEDEDEDEDED